MLMSKTEVFNEVARILGHTYVIADADASQEKLAQAIRRVFQTELITELRSFEWNYYRSRMALTLFKEHPTKDWKFGYTVPNNTAAILAVLPEDFIADLSFSKPNLMYPFSIERWDANMQIIYTHVKKAWAAVTIIPEANEGYDVNFGKSLAARIALSVATQMITNNYFAIKEKLEAACSQQMSNAQANDAQQTPQREPQYSSWLATRNSFDF